MSKPGPRLLPWSVRILTRVLLCAWALAGASAAQARDLYWKSLLVSADLDAEGALHVRERQHMVMTGDWNGGERTFAVGPGQEVVLHGMTRIDPVDGSSHPMREGSLDAVDEYGWVSGTRLRWRSRLSTDPDFDHTDLVYEIDYTTYGVLADRDGTYVLAHDFAFAERAGVIEEHAVTLRIDPAWDVKGPREQTFRTGRLLPGAGHRVVLDLTRAAADAPSALGASPRQARLVLALTVVPVLLLLHLVASEFIRGRFAPLAPDDARRPGWLERNLLHLPAEVVGAVWDRGIGEEEVAALVARLTGEQKITTRVNSANMYLSLKADRGAFNDYERALMDGFFFDGRTETSTSEVRDHYKKTGFDPKSKISGPLEARVQEVVGPSARRWWLPLWLPTLAAFCGGLYLLWRMPGAPENRIPLVLGITIPSLLLGGVASGLAGKWRDRIDRGPLAMIRFLIPMAMLVAFGYLVVTGFRGVPVLGELIGLAGGLAYQARLGATLIVLSFLNSAVNAARSRERAQGIALRKRLASARRYFEQELDRPEPALLDEWFPYVLAFGLDDDAQRWFRSYGAESTSRSTSTSWSGSSSSGGGSGSSGPSGWSGGGGGYGGGGASVSWAAAASSLSAGVAAPSSSSSGGGGGGGGGSGGGSGGGGGGGW